MRPTKPRSLQRERCWTVTRLERNKRTPMGQPVLNSLHGNALGGPLMSTLPSTPTREGYGARDVGTSKSTSAFNLEGLLLSPVYPARQPVLRKHPSMPRFKLNYPIGRIGIRSMLRQVACW